MSDLPVKFDEHGLIAVVIQDDSSDAVLMLAYMNETALEMTRSTGRTHFWSRSRARLWKKGETSGHEQIVKSIHVNCYENSLLIRVDQIGAACHTGFPTCYYRELTDSDQLLETETRHFDPDDVYGLGDDGQINAWLGAYLWLANHDLDAVSGSSRLLHCANVPTLTARIADELRELGGVVSGEHRHVDARSDILLEGSQVFYWLVLAAIRSGHSLPELALLFNQSRNGDELNLAEAISSLADRLTSNPNEFVGAALQIVSVVSQAATTVNLKLRDIIEHDLADLQTRPYLTEYFAVSKT